MEKKPAYIEIIRDGKVLHQISANYHKSFYRYLRKLTPSESPITLRCKHCKTETSFMQRNGGPVFCPACFPKEHKEQFNIDKDKGEYDELYIRENTKYAADWRCVKR